MKTPGAPGAAISNRPRTIPGFSSQYVNRYPGLAYQKTTPLIESGYREIFTVVE